MRPPIGLNLKLKSIKIMENKSNSKWFAAALIYLGFYALIAAAVYFMESAWPLLALVLSPHVNFK